MNGLPVPVVGDPVPDALTLVLKINEMADAITQLADAVLQLNDSHGELYDEFDARVRRAERLARSN